jgi:nucleotide-binding universal stress UspA family protein
VKRILVAVDFSDFTPALTLHAARLARALHAEVVLVHVAEPDPEFVGFGAGPQSRRDDVARRLRREHRDVQALADELAAAGVQAIALFVQGPTVEKLLGEAERLQADLIVMGTQGHGRLHRLLLGSVGEGVLRHARCPVLFVPLPRDDQAPPAA